MAGNDACQKGSGAKLEVAGEISWDLIQTFNHLLSVGGCDAGVTVGLHQMRQEIAVDFAIGIVVKNDETFEGLVSAHAGQPGVDFIGPGFGGEDRPGGFIEDGGLVLEFDPAI